jgi:hypothetical protein
MGTDSYHPVGGMLPETALHLLHHPVFRHLPDPAAFPSIQGMDLFLAALLLSCVFHRFSLFLYKELLDFLSPIVFSSNHVYLCDQPVNLRRNSIQHHYRDGSGLCGNGLFHNQTAGQRRILK